MSQYQLALNELSEVFQKINDDEVDHVVDTLLNANKIVVFGGGRERLQIMGFAMRMFHMGMNATVEGDMTTPNIGKGDVFLVTCGPGWISTAEALIRVAKSAGAHIVVITAQPQGQCVKLADTSLVIPAQTMANDQGMSKTSVLPMGSLFEGALFVLFEVMVLKLKQRLNLTAEDMRMRHTNLE